MATLQVQYDARNATVRRLVQSLIESGIFKPMHNNASPKKRKKRKTGIEEADEDIRAGRVYTAKSVADMFEQLER